MTKVKRSLMPVLAAVSIMGTIGGCETAQNPLPERHAITLEELAVSVRSGHRTYFLSDKKGGFLSGTLRPGSAPDTHRWSVDGVPVASVSGSGTKDAAVDSASISPECATVSYRDGRRMAVTPLEIPGENVRALFLTVSAGAGDEPRIDLIPHRDFLRSIPPANGIQLWKRRGASGWLYCLVDSGAVFRREGFTFPGVSRGEALLLLTQQELAVDSLRALRALVPTFARRRVERMERLLNTSYLRLSDSAMTKAISWIKLSLDALVQERGDTLAVAGLPWNGDFVGRENAQSIAGLGLATGDYEKTAAILRSLARYQDTIEVHRTFGRIPDRVGTAGCSYGGVDVGPWFVREFYEHVTYANDTALARALYPVVRRSILGASKFNTTVDNVMVHGPTELGFGNERFVPFEAGRPPRPGRYAAVELQLLWYFQQLIGSYVADFVQDAERARRWESSARTTAASFDSLFIDTGAKVLYDHLDATGKGILVRRPFPFYALEVLGDERVQQTMIRDLTRSLLYPHGPGTLAASEPGFTPYVTGSQSTVHETANGPVSTYLLGQVTYALTRYDRGDLSYTATRFLAMRALSEGMVGAIPEYLEVRPRPGETVIRSAGLDASLAGMAEFLRAIYQDYLGIHIDTPSMTLRTEPKLPEELSDVAFTVFSGRCAIQGAYRRSVGGEDRITLFAPDLPGPLQWQFTWLMRGGDAWKGAVTVLAGEQVTIVMNADEITAYRGSEEISLLDHWKLKGFSRKDDIAGLGFADSVH